MQAAAECAAAAFAKIDKDASGDISRIELIQAVRSDAGVRSLLGLPATIRQEDGSRDAFEAVFQAMAADHAKVVTESDFVRVFGAGAVSPADGAGPSVGRGSSPKLLTMAASTASSGLPPAMAALDAVSAATAGADAAGIALEGMASASPAGGGGGDVGDGDGGGGDANPAAAMATFALRMGMLAPPPLVARDSLEGKYPAMADAEATT